MDPIQCCHCGDFFAPSPRHKNQVTCGKAQCRRVRRGAWQKYKLCADPDYRFNQKRCQKRWVERHPGYWKEYRQRHPETVAKNRAMQRLRNRRARGDPTGRAGEATLIAKMDASHREAFQLLGEFWMVPVIAKMDPFRAHILKLPASYP